MNEPLRRLFIASLLIALTGCTLKPRLLSASFKTVNDEEMVEVVIPSRDAESIKNREMYFSIVVLDCQDSKRRFPIEPYIQGQLVSDFSFPIGREVVTIYGSMPQRVLADFRDPCVALQGGSYLSGRMASSLVPLVRDVDDE